jgi:DNA-binding CsgD family transcriptional regulator
MNAASRWPQGKAARISVLGSGVVDEESAMPQMEFLKNKFDLTPAEARLVVRLIEGESLRPCAKALGIQYETVRTYLKSVFQKTKTRRQAELVLVVIRAMNAANLGEVDALQASTADKTTRAPLAPTL